MVVGRMPLCVRLCVYRRETGPLRPARALHSNTFRIFVICSIAIESEACLQQAIFRQKSTEFQF